MRRAVPIAAAAALAVAVSATAAPTAGGFATYVHAARAFAIEYPAAWRVFEEDGASGSVAFYDERAVSRDDHPLIGFEVSFEPCEGSAGQSAAGFLAAVAKEERSRFARKNPLFDLESEGAAADGPLGARYVLRYRGVRKAGAETQVAYQTILRRGGSVIRLTGKGLASRETDFRGLYDRIAASLQAPSPAAAPAPKLPR